MSRTRALEPRKLPRQTRARATVLSILQATAHILIRDGYQGLNTNRVAERAGVSIGSLYQYFPQKEALVAALLQEHADANYHAIRAALEQTGSGATLRGAIATAVEQIVDVHAADPAVQRVLTSGIPAMELKAWEDAMRARIYSLGLALLQPHRASMRSTLDLGSALTIIHSMSRAIIDDAVLNDHEKLRSPKLKEEITAAVYAYLADQSVAA
ncbi:TetR/AcrR family transcriptional regulator [Sphingobium sp. 3R8]|uniref:TetR/AcrR family transcriptional regulator n=1 Tax=Sphingobium sp. 3R8 TaxID=2874921 RepID=UPI001CCDA392|nr:TetR/AcrR family transcriptional regulator [Sphingobium sp. 3R8]MBZ9650264.1 TetR/AcrR family transcriptional regulator [Sphingobium sp. 3R8]